MATKAEKEVVIAELTERLKASDAVYLTDYSGMTVAQISALRGEFKKAGVTYKVYKNTMVKRAMKQIGGYEAIFPTLEEQTAYAFTQGDLTKPAKVLKAFLKDSEKPKFRGAIMDGVVFGENQLEALSTMKSKDEVIGDIMGLLLSPIRNVLGALQSPGSTLVGAVKTIAEKQN
jgi:large subunit ribosomal protein L10